MSSLDTGGAPPVAGLEDLVDERPSNIFYHGKLGGRRGILLGGESFDNAPVIGLTECGLGLFSGIGGFELAFSQAGFETALLSEIDAAANAVLRQHFQGVEVHADVVDITDIPSDTSIITAGFPCQNLSMAGDKSGINGSKSGVVEKIFEIIERSAGSDDSDRKCLFHSAAGSRQWNAMARRAVRYRV